MISNGALRQVFLFVIVGVIATATHYLVALLSYEILVINLYVSNLIGYGCAIAVSYFGHGYFTFQVDLNQRVFWRFLIASITTFLGSEVILAALEIYLQFSHRISLAIVVMTIPAITFLLNKMWVFRNPSN